MKDLNIARAILTNRKVKGITQEDLANYIGVSKASVSKWETGQSYPDITFLPQLATYFNISIDQLIGYEPQLTKADIRKLYLKLANDFSTLPFEEVVADCQEIIKKYYSCYPLLFQIGVLLLNHSSLAGEQGRALEIIQVAKALFIRVKEESDEVGLINQALQVEAFSLTLLQAPAEVVQLLGDSDSLVFSSKEILATAYQMLGQSEKAKETLQIEIYQYLMIVLKLLQSYLSLMLAEEKEFEEIVTRFLALAEVFKLTELKPDCLLTFYYTVAQFYGMKDQPEKALTFLAKYADLATSNIYPLSLKGDNFFTLIDGFFEDLVIGVNPPRDEKVIKQSMYDGVVNNPVFLMFTEDESFKQIVTQLKSIC